MALAAKNKLLVINKNKTSLFVFPSINRSSVIPKDVLDHITPIIDNVSLTSLRMPRVGRLDGSSELLGLPNPRLTVILVTMLLEIRHIYIFLVDILSISCQSGYRYLRKSAHPVSTCQADAQSEDYI